MASSYAYTGGATMYYQDYRDAETGKMLVASPGETYWIVAIDDTRFPVPPSDGRWMEAPPPPPPPPSGPKSVSAPAPAPEGGES